MTSKIRLEGIITAVEPVSTTFPKATADTIPDYETRKRVDSYLQKGTMQINRDGQISEEPIISATALKSKLRHACADAIIFARAAAGNKVRLKDVYLMKVGQDADAKSNKEKLESGESTAVDVGAINEFREANSIADQFGLFEISGNLAVSAGIPVQKTELSYLGGVRHDIPARYISDYAEGEAAEQYLQRRINNTLLSQSKTEVEEKRRELKKVRKDANLKKGEESANSDKLNKEIEALEAKIEALEEAQGDQTISTQMPIPARHCAAQGTQFNQTITINDGSTKGLSMIVYGLNELSKNCKIGAYKTSAGEISGKWDVYLITDGIKELKGSLEIGGFVNSVFTAVDEDAQTWWNENALNEDWIK